MPKFNCLNEPWFTVRAQNGSLREVGIRDALLTAHELESIYDPSPLVQFGIYRLLVAFVTDAYSVSSLRRIGSLIRQGHFDAETLDTYVAACGDVFDLFSMERPFLQSRPNPELDKEPKSVAYLFQHIPTGNNVSHFYHGTQSMHKFSPAVCARALCTISPFMTIGGKGLTASLNGTPPWYLLIKGNNLFETIVLNCCVIELGLGGVEPVSWLSSREVCKRAFSEISLLEGLTWQPRRVRLIPGTAGICTYSGRQEPLLIRDIYFSWGFEMKAQGVWHDPNVAYKITDKAKEQILPSKDRAAWRDIAPFTLLRQQDYVSPQGKLRFERPRIVDQYFSLRADRRINKEHVAFLELYGIETRQAKMIDWRYESLALPSGLEELLGAAAYVQAILQKAEDVSYALTKSVRLAHPQEFRKSLEKKGGGKKHREVLQGHIDRAQMIYWPTLEPSFFSMLGQLTQNGLDDPKLIAVWNKQVQSSGWSALEKVLAELDADAEALKRQVEVRKAFGQRIDRILYGKESKDGQSKGAK